MKYLLLMIMAYLFLSCGKSSGSKGSSDTTFTPALTAADALMAKFSYPVANQLVFEGSILADLTSSDPTVSPYGSVLRGQAVNVLTIDSQEFAVYGEDGVFAAECEPHGSYPDHGPTHPKCQVAHAESFDKIIVCFSTQSSTPMAVAQNWPGTETAMEDESLGVQCWVNGVKMLSNKIFTY